MTTAQPPEMVPQAAYLKLQRERDYWRNRCLEAEKQLTQEKQQQQQQRQLWKTKLKSTEKATLSEFQRQLESPQAHRDERGFTRICYSTAAINTGVTPNTPKLSFEKTLTQCPDLLTLAVAEIETRKEYDPDLRRPIPRLYMKAEKSLIEAAIHSEISQRIKQGGNQYICQRCLSPHVRKDTQIVCLDCGHISHLESTYPNGKLKNSTTGISGNTNLESPPQKGYSSENEPPPAENFLTSPSQAVGLVITNRITSDPPLEADRLAAAQAEALSESESEESVIEEAAALLLAIAGDDENHIEMSRAGRKKYYDADPPRPLELADLIEHLRAGQAKGSHCCYRDGRTRAQCFDKDDDVTWEQLRAAARKLAQVGYSPVLEESSAANRGGHLWIIYSDLVDAVAARAAVLAIAPELAECTEYWPGPVGAKHWNRVRLPGGFYARYGQYVEQPIKAWCRLTNVAAGDISWDGVSAAKLLLASQTPAAVVPAQPVIEGEPVPGNDVQSGQDERVQAHDPEVPPVSAERAGALPNGVEAPVYELRTELEKRLGYRVPVVDEQWEAAYGPIETTTWWFAIVPAYAARWFNERHPLEDVRPCEPHTRMAFSPNGNERTPSMSYRETPEGERYTDHSMNGRRSDGTRDSGDAFELECKVRGISKPELAAQIAREIQGIARAEMERAAAAGEPLPPWFEEPECLITPAGRRKFAELLAQGKARQPGTAALASTTDAKREPKTAAASILYVDEIRTCETPLPYKQWCHLAVAGDLEQLHAFARRLGLKPGWFQDKPGHPHYDLTPGKRAQAIKLGAVPVSSVELVRRCYPVLARAAEREQGVESAVVQQAERTSTEEHDGYTIDEDGDYLF